MADAVVSKENVLYIRYFAEASAIKSDFIILFTAFREKASTPGCKASLWTTNDFRLIFFLVASCVDTEYDCEDNTCIASNLQCNGRVNCRFEWDEESCKVSLEIIFIFSNL